MKISKLFLFFLISNIILLQTCKKVEKEMLVSTGTVSNIMMTTADISGKILDLGEGVSAYGHCYGTSSNTTVSGPKTEISVPASVRSFTSNLTGLMPGTKYYVTAYCSRGNETVYGDEISFITLSDAKPLVTTAEITGIDKFTAVGGGNVTNEGGTPVTARGVCYSLAVNPTIDNDKVSSGSGTGIFSCNLTLLTADKKYYVRAYATNLGGTSYGDERNFTTLPDVPVPPTVTTDEVSLVTAYSAVCGGNVTAEGSAAVTAKGVCWGTNSTPTLEENNKTNNGTGTGHFVSNITGLDPGTKYYVRAYAINSVNPSYGTAYNFTTDAVIPTLNTLPITSVTSTSASSGGDITSTGGASITSKGVCWRTSPGPNIYDNKTENGMGPDDFVSSLTNLQTGTKYYLRAYATNSVGPGYGNEVEFTTYLSPTATTGDATSINKTSAILNGTVNANGQTSVVTFEYGLSTTYGTTITAMQSPVTGTANTPVSASIAGLSEGTVYHYKVQAVNAGGTSDGEDKIFTTLCNPPTVTTEPATNVTSTTTVLNGFVNANGFSTAVTFEYGLTTGYGSSKTATQSPVTGSTSTPVNVPITDLEPNKTYYFRIRTESCGGTIYSTDYKSFTTKCVLPSATAATPINIAWSEATLVGIVNPNGFSTAATFEYGTSTGYGNTKIATQSPVTGNSSVTVNANIVGLIPNTTYHFIIKAENCAGIVYSEDKSFSTPCLYPTATTNPATSITDISATFNGVVNSNNGSTVVTFEYGTTMSYGSTANATPSPVTGTSNVVVTATDVTLLRNRLYYYRIKAENCGGTIYGDPMQFTTANCPASITKNHIAGPVAPVTKTVTYGVIETNLSGSYACWITKNLGATSQPSSAYTTLESRAGWYWQFNRKQGYMHDGTTRTPATWDTPINEIDDWLEANDPCYLLLGTGWRIPSLIEWTNVDNNGGWNNAVDAFNSVLKLHCAGILSEADGSLVDRGGSGIYWNRLNYYNERNRPLIINSTYSAIGNIYKVAGASVRCIKP